VSGGNSSITALAGSTEEQQFGKTATPSPRARRAGR